MDEARAPAHSMQTLVRGLTARRPPRAGSLIVTVFGDVVMPRGGLIATQSILDVLGLLGLTPGLVRTALSRLTSDGMFERSRAGRHSFYRLSDEAWARYEDASAVIYADARPAWDGGWLVVMLVDGPAASTAAADGDESLRRGLTDLGFAKAGPALYLRPANLGPAERRRLDVLLDDRPALLVDGRGGAIPAGFKATVEGTWGLADLARGYDQFARRYGPLATALDRGAPLDDAEALSLRILVIHDYRLLVLKDPRLPPEILPAGWQGEASRLICRDLYRRVYAASERWVDAHCTGDHGPLPPPGGLVLERFGG